MIVRVIAKENCPQLTMSCGLRPSDLACAVAHFQVHPALSAVMILGGPGAMATGKRKAPERRPKPQAPLISPFNVLSAPQRENESESVIGGQEAAVKLRYVKSKESRKRQTHER